MNGIKKFISNCSSWFSSSEKPTKRKRSTKSSPKKRKTDSGSQDVPSNPIQITSIEPIRLDPTSSMLADAYEKVFYEYAEDGNIIDEAKLLEITKGIYQLSEKSLHKIAEYLNQILYVHDFLKENNYVKPVINLIAVISTLKVFDIYEKSITVPNNLTINGYCKLMDDVIHTRKMHNSYSSDLQIFQDDFESKKTELLRNIRMFNKMIESKRSGNAIVYKSDSECYENVINRISSRIDDEKKKNDKLNAVDETKTITRFIFESLSDSDLELIKKMKSSIKCKGIDGSGFELDKLVDFLKDIDNLLTKNIKSAKDYFESGDKKYCKKIYNIIETMIDPIVKKIRKSIDEINRENKEIEGFDNEINKLNRSYGGGNTPKKEELMNKKRISEENIVKNKSIQRDAKTELNDIIKSFNQYGNVLKPMDRKCKTTLKKKLDGLVGLDCYVDEYKNLCSLLI